MDNKKLVTTIILAAGQGKRMGSKVAKQYLEINEKPILYYSLKAFDESKVDNIIVVVGKNEIDYCRNNIVNKYEFVKGIDIIEGGKERYDSVYKALEQKNNVDYIMVHDGARPFIKKDNINEMIDYLKKNGACIFGVPITDTIKIIDNGGYIKKTPERSRLWAAQTPQSFEYIQLKKAYHMMYIEKTFTGMTDDASIYERYINEPVKILLGDYTNIKITTQKDLIFAERYLEEAYNKYKNKEKLKK